MELSYDRAAGADPLDARATITLLVVSILLSGMRFQGSDFDFLVPTWQAMPGEAWRLVTANLLHGSWLHLAFNVYWTFRFGVVVEALFGTFRTTLLYLLLGAGSMAAEWAFGGPAVGLSGIGFGLFGLLWALGRWHPDCHGLLDRRVAELFAAWFLLCIIASWQDIWPVANVAHGAGALLGGLSGWSLAAPRGLRLARAGVLAFAVAWIAVCATMLRPTLNRSEHYVLELFERGLAASQVGDHARAAGYYKALLARRDDAREAWHNLGLSYLALGRGEEAADAFRRAQALEAQTE